MKKVILSFAVVVMLMSEVVYGQSIEQTIIFNQNFSYDASLNPGVGPRYNPNVGKNFNDFMLSKDGKVVFLSIYLTDVMTKELKEIDSYNRIVFSVADNYDERGHGGNEYLIHLPDDGSRDFSFNEDTGKLSGYFKVWGINGPRQGFMSVNLRPISTKKQELNGSSDSKCVDGRLNSAQIRKLVNNKMASGTKLDVSVPYSWQEVQKSNGTATFKKEGSTTLTGRWKISYNELCWCYGKCDRYKCKYVESRKNCSVWYYIDTETGKKTGRIDEWINIR